MKKQYIDGPMGQVHLRDVGEGRPLVLLHQTAWSSVQFLKAMPILANYGFRCIAIDTPGYGMSDTNIEIPSIDKYVESLKIVLDKMSIKEPVIIAHHTGASIATKFASMFPENIKHLILHGVAIYSKEEAKVKIQKPHFDQTPTENGLHFVERWKYAKNVVGQQVSKETIHNSLMQFFTAGKKEWHGHHVAFTYNLRSDYERLITPTSIISNTGDPLDSKVPELKKIRPDFKYFEIEGGTFHIIFDEPERWCDFIYNNILKGLK